MSRFSLSSLYVDLAKEDKLSLFVLFVSIAINSINPWIPVLGILFVTFIYCRNVEVNGMFVYLLLTWLFYDYLGLMNGNTSLQMSIYLAVPSLLFFNFGCQWVNRNPSITSIYLAMASIIVALALPHILVTIYDITQVGLVNAERTLSIFDEDNQRSITQRTIEISMCIGSIGLFFQRKDGTEEMQKISRILFFISVLALLCSLHYVSRTGVAIMLASITIGLVFKWGVSVKTLIFALLAVFCYSWLQGTELFDVYMARENDYSNISNAGQRLPRWEWALQTTFENPFGNSHFMSAEHPYAHNFWLDIGKNCGVIPFFMMCFFSLFHLLQVWKIFRMRYVVLAFMFVLWTMTCYMSLFTEPIHEGVTLFMFVYFFFCGMCYKMTRCELSI